MMGDDKNDDYIHQKNNPAIGEKETTQLLWDDDICLNPYDEYINEGRIEGKKAGLESGYNEGYQVGKLKAIHIGFEIGFIRGVLDTITNEPEIAVRRNEKVDNTIKKLYEALDEFSSSLKECNQINEPAIPDAESKLASTATAVAASSSSSFDPTEKIQRIRAKYKLLMIQLKLPASKYLSSIKSFLRESHQLLQPQNTTQASLSSSSTTSNDKNNNLLDTTSSTKTAPIASIETETTSTNLTTSSSTNLNDTSW